MTAESSRWTPFLILVVLAVGLAVWYVTPQGGDGAAGPEVGETLAFVRVRSPVGPGFNETAPFTVDVDYERIGLSYNFTTAYHVRAAVTAPDGSRHDATPEGNDTLRLELHDPPQGDWTFRVWTLDEPERQGRIERGDIWIAGYGGPNVPART